MKLTPLQKRAERQSRNQSALDMNLVALIDIFTILIFFLLSSAAGVEILTNSKAVKLPESISQKAPVETVVVTVTASEIVVDGRLVARVDEALATDGDLIAPLKAELDLLQANRKVIREDNAAQARAVTIMGDKDIPYRLLRKVMYTAAQANYSDVSFAVNRKLMS
ncbi:MAG: biopolymer transporter ExbD [Ideonella sp.]|jgi:biopolymer transport protein ExbD|nr:biopolymer transporter ExbD [Ideonella sp.]